MVMRSTLRFEPVNCVVTILAESGASVSVFDIEQRESNDFLSNGHASNDFLSSLPKFGFCYNAT